MLGNTGTYANKKRKKPVLKQKKISDGNEVVKSNPSKRHRDRLNGELDRLTDLLPFPEDVRSRLDKLSVLRLSVGYLRVKSYFKATMKNGSSGLTSPGLNGQNRNKMEVAGFTEGDILLQALNGFVMLVTSEGLVFYASPTIKDYLGFDQSDVVHQSVFELIHTDDRDLFRQQLHFALNPPSLPAGVDVLQGCGSTVMYNPEHLPPENSSFLERSFVCRFRCLLDNSSGFLALKFQGRLKYLHGQNILRGNRDKPQLGLFAIAIPVQPPSIVEIRAKMLLFQTKHKLDFTPTGIDSRGKIILGYTETELCMKGSGYQFIHAADMMHCADKHIRMIKTGESGLTVFRLLSKSNGWVWVKSNAKLIYKAGRPEFIIAYQKAIINAEGEEHLHQRRLQLPFGFATGEAILYDTGPTVDITLFQFNKQFNTSNMSENVTPGSLLDCFIRQDEAVYTERVEPPLPVDRVFMESHALVSVPSDSWAENGSGTTTGNCVVKEEAKKSVMSVIDNLEKVAQSGDFSEVLQTLDVSDAELVEWENALSRMGQDEGQQSDVSSELDSVLANDIFDYLESVLFQESGGGCVNARRPDPPEPFPPAACFSDLQLCESDLFKTQSPGHPYSPKNGLTGQSFNDSAQIFNGTQKLSHQGPLIAQPDTNMPSLQELQLQDIFSPSIELPELVVPDAFVEDSPAPFQSCGQVSVSHVGYPQGISGHTQCPGNHMQSPAMAANGQMLQSCGKPLNDVAPGVMDILPPLIPCNDFISSTSPNIHVPIASARLQGAPPFETHKVKQQKLHHTGVTLSGHEPMPACNGQTSESQTFPQNGLWPRSGCRLSHSQQGGLACGQAAAQNGCAYDQHFSSSPAVGDVLTLSGSSVQMESPLQGSCFFQWSHGEPETVTSAVNQQNGNIMSPSQHALHIPHYQEPLRHRTQDERPSAQLCGIVAPPSALGGHRPG